MATLSKPCKPDNFELNNSLKLCFTNIWGPPSNLVDCESFIESFIEWDKPGWLNSFWQFLCERLSSFDQKGFYYSYAWSHSLSERKTSFCMGLFSRKLCRFLFMFSTGFTSLSVFFFLYQLPSSALRMVFYSISSNIDEVLLINPSPVFVFGDFNIHH